MDEQVDRTEPEVEPAPLSREAQVARRPRLRRLVIPALLIAAGLGVGWYWWTQHGVRPGGSSGPGRVAQVAPQPVGAATIDKGDVHIVLNELGTVTPLATVTVKTQINGQLIDVGFKEGQVVKKGDFLAQIDPRPYQVTLEQAQGQLAHDQGLLQQAQTDLKRYQTLGRQDSIAQQQVDDQRFLVAQYMGSVQSDQAQVDSAKLNLTYCHITALVDGQVGLRQVDAGNYVQTSDANGLVVITQMQPISVIFSVPEDNLPDILQRLHAGATLSVDAYDRANVRLLATGQLATLDNQIDTTTGTLKLRALFANPDELLFPNQFVNARLLVDTMQATVRVPVPAVQRGEPGTYVYVINAEQHRLGAPGEAGADRWRLYGGAVGAATRREGGDRRHRPAARRRQGDCPVPGARSGTGAGTGARSGRSGTGRPAPSPIQPSPRTASMATAIRRRRHDPRRPA